MSSLRDRGSWNFLMSKPPARRYQRPLSPLKKEEEKRGRGNRPPSKAPNREGDNDRLLPPHSPLPAPSHRQEGTLRSDWLRRGEEKTFKNFLFSLLLAKFSFLLAAGWIIFEFDFWFWRILKNKKTKTFIACVDQERGLLGFSSGIIEVLYSGMELSFPISVSANTTCVWPVSFHKGLPIFFIINNQDCRVWQIKTFQQVRKTNSPQPRSL